MPRPVLGLAGKAIDMAVGDEGQVAVRVLRQELHRVISAIWWRGSWR